MADIHAILLIPDDPSILDDGPCGAKPPMVRVAHKWGWPVRPWGRSEAGQTGCVRCGETGAWQIRTAVLQDTPPDSGICCLALVLAWEGEVVPIGCAWAKPVWGAVLARQVQFVLEGHPVSGTMMPLPGTLIPSAPTTRRSAMTIDSSDLDLRLTEEQTEILSTWAGELVEEHGAIAAGLVDALHDRAVLAAEVRRLREGIEALVEEYDQPRAVGGRAYDSWGDGELHGKQLAARALDDLLHPDEEDRDG